MVFAQKLRKVGNFGLSRPTRELLFVPILKEDRYKAKNFIDTVIYRGGDQVRSWVYTGLTALELATTGIAVLAIPLSAVWLGISAWLGKRQQKMELDKLNNKSY